MNIIELAREHASRYTNRHYPDKPVYTFTQDALERFATLVRAAALEEAAGVCETNADRWPGTSKVYAALECAAAIRALKESNHDPLPPLRQDRPAT